MCKTLATPFKRKVRLNNNRWKESDLIPDKKKKIILFYSLEKLHLSNEELRKGWVCNSKCYSALKNSQ